MPSECCGRRFAGPRGSSTTPRPGWRREDPVGFLDFDGLIFIDEVQRVPDLWLAVKNAVDRDPLPGRFIPTGSARLLALQSIPDTLPGRSETIELWPDRSHSLTIDSGWREVANACLAWLQRQSL